MTRPYVYVTGVLVLIACVVALLLAGRKTSCFSSSLTVGPGAGRNAAGGERPYQQPKRYMPSRFDRRQNFAPGETPLTMLQAGKAPLPEPPADWDGGYTWKFVKYHPSKWEVSWRNDVPAVETKPGSPLCALQDSKYAKENEIYIKNLARMPAHTITQDCPGTVPDEPMEFDPDIFSRFEYTFQCQLEPCLSPPPANGPKVGDVKFTYIEPLVGILRHPRGCTKNKWILDKNYMIFDPWTHANVGRSTASPEPRTLFLDAGASFWSSGAGGPSQQWFYSLFESMCIRVTDWYMWEMEGLDPRKVLGALPGDIKPGYRWFNVPLSVSADSWDNPINHLLREAKEEDTVLFKIDFDAPVVEEKLLAQILDFDAVHSLVGELWFEDHANFAPMNRHWVGYYVDTRTYTDSLQLFTQLREKGIRAHSWV